MKLHTKYMENIVMAQGCSEYPLQGINSWLQG